MESDQGVDIGLDPLSPRSIVLSVLLGSDPPAMPVRRLLEFTSLFDINDGAVRTALSRMAASGELVADGGTYRLGERHLARRAEQEAGRLGPPASWDGTWWFVVVTAASRSVAARRTFRSRVTGARLGELRPDVWLRPANVDVPDDLPDVVITRGRLSTGDDRRLAAQLWDLDALDRRAAELAGRARHAVDTLAGRHGDDHDADTALAGAFVTLAACLRHLRTEPQLPVELAPNTAAAELRVEYDAAVTAFQRRLREFFGRG